MGMQESKKGKLLTKVHEHRPWPFFHGVLFVMASGCLASWVMGLFFYPAKGGLAIFGLITWNLVWLQVFDWLYGPVEAQDGDTEGKERG